GVLEVNAPIVDYPRSPKRRLDRALIVEPLRRWRDWQCRTASLIVTPSAATVPDWVARERIVELEGGGDTARFHPDIAPVCVADGPERVPAERAAAGIEGVRFRGAIPHDRMPSALASADIGVA